MPLCMPGLLLEGMGPRSVYALGSITTFIGLGYVSLAIGQVRLKMEMFCPHRFLAYVKNWREVNAKMWSVIQNVRRSK